MNDIVLLIVGIVLCIPGGRLWYSALMLFIREKTFSQYMLETDDMWISLKLFFNPGRMFQQFWRLFIGSLLLSIGVAFVATSTLHLLVT